MTKEEIKELNNIIFDKLNTKEYSNILGEYTRLIQENKHLNEQLDIALKDYDKLQQRIDKANDELINLIQIINEQPSNNVEEDNYLLGKLESISNILKGDSNE